MLERIKAVVIGHAVGDALGVPVEFCDREELKEKPITEMVGYGSYPVPPGAWSDDTSMSLAALDSLANGSIDFEVIMDNFVKWCSCDEYTPTGEMFDIGRTCLNAIRRYLTNDDLPAIKSGLNDEYSNGNGSLMRIHPFVLMAHYNRNAHMVWEELIEKASSLTHAHERSILACKIYTTILFNLLSVPQKNSVRLALRYAKCYYAQSPEFSHYNRLFDEGFERLAEQDIKSTGYVVDTLEAAIWCLLTTNSYAECVLKAVNLGEDTDTVAAVAGGLAGALYGYEAIPESWRNTLIKRDFIEEMCERAQKNWI